MSLNNFDEGGYREQRDAARAGIYNRVEKFAH